MQAREGADVVRFDVGKHPDPQLVAAELAVGLGVHHPVGPQRFARSRPRRRRRSRWWPPPGERVAGVGDERHRVRRRLRPGVDPPGRVGGAGGGEGQPALVVQPVQLVVQQEERGDRGGVQGLVLPGVGHRDGQAQGVRDPAVRGREPLRPFQARRGTAGPATARRRSRGSSAARSSTRRSGRRRPRPRRPPTCRRRPSMRPRRRRRSAAPGPGRRSRSRCAPRRRRPRRPRRPGSTADPAGGRDHVRGVQMGGRRGGRRELGRELPEAGVRAAALDQRDTPRGPRTASTRRCPAPPRTPRAGRTAPRVPREPRRPGPSPEPGGARSRAVATRRGTSAATASGRILAGPQPNRPSLGSRSAGISRMVTPTDSSIRTPTARLRSCLTCPANASTTTASTCSKSAAPADPYALFDSWLSDAFAAKERGVLPEPTAMVVATSIGDRPSARTVLLKGFDADRLRLLHQLRLAQGQTSWRAIRTRRCTSAGIRCSGRFGSRGRSGGLPGMRRRPTSRPGRADRSWALGRPPSPAWWPRSRP